MEGMEVNPSFWHNRNVFVTGHTGFKGSWLCLLLRQAGATVTGYALPPPTNPSLFEVANASEGMKSIFGDIRNGEMLSRAMRESSAEIVLHMAAQPLVRRSYVDPVETYSTNVLGTVNVLEAVRSTPSVRAVVNVTSDKCYENREWVWGYRENEPMGGFDPYSSSKGCAELVTSAYQNSFFSPTKYREHGVALGSARAGNVIGGGDWAEDRLIPDILRAMSEGRSVVIRNPLAVRPWQHVLEPLTGYLLLAQRLHEVGVVYAEGWNFGPNDEDARTVEWIVTRLTQHWGTGASWKLDGAGHPHEAHYLKLDCSKARTRLGWQPRWNLERALEMTIAWHRAWLAKEDMHIVTMKQIEQYTQ